MFTQDQDLDLTNVGDGELNQQFAEELTKLLRNIEDQETGDEVREINIKIKLKPNPEKRGMVQMSCQVASKAAPRKAVQTVAMIAHEGKGPVLKEWIQKKQKDIFQLTKQKEESDG